jgi:hypothetical protein
MLRSALSLLILGLSIAAASAAIDLTVTPHQVTENGTTFQELHFRDGSQKVAMVLQPGWSFRSSPARLTLTPPAELKFAEGTVEASPLGAPAAPWDEASVQSAVQQVLASVPPGSQDVELLGEFRDTLMLKGMPSLEVMISYKAMGERFNRSVIIVHLPESRVVARFTARAADFRDGYIGFQRALLSCEWR